MSEWFWVVLGFAITYLSMIGYLLWTTRQAAGVRRQLEGLR